MLSSLSIRDVVLIDKLDLEFSDGLGVLTGETGAGKSILLDSLALALGERGDSGLIRPGSEKLTVTAAFDVPAQHPVKRLLADQEMTLNDDAVVLRRSLGRDGRSRAFINDQAVSVGLLRQVGAALVEVHGQFDVHGLMDARTHMGVLDCFRQITRGTAEDTACQDSWKSWRTAYDAWKKAEQVLRDAKAEEDMLRAEVEILVRLAPEAGEETDLAAKRAMLRHGEQILSAIESARKGPNGTG